MKDFWFEEVVSYLPKQATKPEQCIVLSQTKMSFMHCRYPRGAARADMTSKQFYQTLKRSSDLEMQPQFEEGWRGQVQWSALFLRSQW